jgi:hypothetical protein
VAGPIKNVNRLEVKVLKIDLAGTVGNTTFTVSDWLVEQRISHGAIPCW